MKACCVCGKVTRDPFKTTKGAVVCSEKCLLNLLGVTDVVVVFPKEEKQQERLRSV